LATLALEAALDDLLPRLQAVWHEPPHREHQFAADRDILQQGAAVTERSAVRSRPSR
jgi:hypothetical protein